MACLVSTVGLAAPASAALPACTGGRASAKAPTSRPGTGSAKACQAYALAREAQVQPAQSEGGYTHLGAGTADEWTGVYGRVSVVDPVVRSNTYDFLASRFMVKQDLGRGRVAWLEAGWAETGWSGRGSQRIYTYNSNTNAWQFYDQYDLAPGDRVWLDLHTDGNGVWQAWLWWNNRWNLLTSQKLPIGGSAYVEQYVEQYVDGRRPTRLRVPPVTFDNVQLRSPSAYRYWRDDVPTVTGRSGSFCLNWQTHFDTWTAGDCR
ncbi:hypothetical protein [Actinoplanes sp. N902-109]|uniref:hypothetical protein n=1 Tax=Actinoplanes sp. (strain N902-109) TaxID=649831 RepID=UPI00032938A6|nr:hypothetical protein [Actinoplanes sp. N902-109]AGL13827.1 hypothetical protein L083_0317 [Actinoplanes sp. N902-109]